jgi:signal transduction histidine kinase
MDHPRCSASADDRRPPMSPARRLSLRARMLVIIVGVTTILLLIMGTVSTYLFVRRVDGQAAAATRRLNQLADILVSRPWEAEANAQTASVVEISFQSRVSVAGLTTGPATRQLSVAVSKWLTSQPIARARALAHSGQALGARDLLASGGCQHFPGNGCRPLAIAPKTQAVARRLPGTVTGEAASSRPAILFIGQPVSSGAAQVRGFIIAELITGAALISLLAVGGEWLIGRGLIPLDEMTRTADEITSRGDLTARMPDSDAQTEVGRLGSSINTMLDGIQHAFGSRLRSEQKVREFAADASHELRTPLTTIRGYAELYRQGALGPDQLPNAMRRIEQEAERMSMLVAELLELARLDRTSSLDLGETDLAGIVRDAVADAIAVEPRRPVRAEAPPRLVAVVDEPRIRQVLANLLGNVRAHTPVTTPVAVRLGAINGGVLIEVADAGPGMSTQDAIRAFDRFHRAAERSAEEAADDGDAGENVHEQGGNGAVRAGAAASGPAAGRRGRGAVRGAAASAVSGAPVRGAAASGAALNGAPVNGSPVNGSPASRSQVSASAVTGPAVSRPAVGEASGGSGRAEPERTSGSGLGLSIVQAIANAHGGRATLESFPGQGTKVRVWLPVRIVP